MIKFKMIQGNLKPFTFVLNIYTVQILEAEADFKVNIRTTE